MGRPKKIKNVKAMQRNIKKYLKECEGEILTDDNGEPVINKKTGEPIRIGAKPPTMTGIARACGLGSRQALLNYKKDDEFIDTINDARAIIEEKSEERLFCRDSAPGAIFNLKCNFGWRENEAEQSTANVGVVILPEISEPPEKIDDS